MKISEAAISGKGPPRAVSMSHFRIDDSGTPGGETEVHSPGAATIKSTNDDDAWLLYSVMADGQGYALLHKLFEFRC